MGFLQTLFGKKDKPTKTKKSVKNGTKDKISFQDGFAEIDALNFFGEYSASPSGEWAITWSEAERGRYILFNRTENAAKVDGRMARPNNANVADNGVFAIENWGQGGTLGGTYCVFSADGVAIVKKRFAANLISNGISPTGKLAICQTANAPTGKDGNLLTAFDLQSGKKLFSIHPETPWAHDYEFDEQTVRFGLVIEGIGTFFYDKNGVFEQPEVYEKCCLQSDQYHTAIIAAESILKSEDASEARIKAALDACKKSLLNGVEDNPNWQAFVHKWEGVAHERLGQDSEALTAFEKALSLDPKIGVKRQANAIRKRLRTE